MSLLLALLPLLSLLAALVFGRFPGVRLLESLSRVLSSAWPRARSVTLASRVQSAWLPRGGSLLAGALAGRGPPEA